jgi:L-rhamnose isomerase
LASVTRQQDDNKREHQALRHAAELLEVEKKAGSEALAVWQRKAEEAQAMRTSTQQELAKAQELSAHLQTQVGSFALTDVS